MKSLLVTLAKFTYKLMNKDETLLYLLLIALLSLELLMVVN